MQPINCWLPGISQFHNMAQQRLRDYQSPLGSFLHNLVNLGIHKPGRFCGFDTLQQTGVLQFSLAHIKSGINTLDTGGNPYGPLAVMMSNQGEIVIEDAPITALILTTNAGNASPRRDYVVMSHSYFQVLPAAAATYAVLTGPLNSAIAGIGNPPTLNQYQTLIGIIDVPAGATNINQCTYTKAIPPDSGDESDAHLNQPNLFKAANVEGAVDMGPIGYSRVDDGIWMWDLPSKGNTFYFLQPNQVVIDGIRVPGITNQDGFEINLIIGSNTRIRSFNNQGNTATLLPTVSALGFRPIIFADRIKNQVEIINSQYCPSFTPVGLTAQVCLSLVMVNGVWMVKAIDGPGFIPPRTGNYREVAEIHMQLSEIPTYFDIDSGAGMSSWFNWQLCNGLNLTWDMRGRVGVMAVNGVPATGAPPVDGSISGALAPEFTGGETNHTLSQVELPNVQLKLLSYRGNGEVYVHDTAGGGSNIGAKNDADNNANNPGPILTTPLGSGLPHNNMQPYICVLYAMYVGA